MTHKPTRFEPVPQELLHWLGRLVAARTENPPGNEALAAAVVTEFFDACGIPYDIYEPAPGRTSVAGHVGSGRPELLVACHLDVVPAGDGWTGDPFQLRVDDGLCIGRGVSDNKGQAAALLLATRFLKDHSPLRGTFTALFVADEERGSAMGLEWLMANGKLLPDFAVIPDIGGYMKQIDVVEKGLLFVEVAAEGKQAHGSTPELGVNAIGIVTDFLARLRERPVPSATHALLTPTTMNLGMIHGGVAPNVVPGRCTATLDIRFLPGQRSEDILAHLEALADETRRAFPEGRIALKIDSLMPPTEVPADHPLVESLRQAIREAAGREASVAGIGGATVAKQLIPRGVPAVCFGPGDEHQAHMADESIELAELLSFSGVLVLVAQKLLGGESKI